MDLTIVITSHNTKELTKACLDSVAEYTKDIKYEIIAVDNASTDGSWLMLTSLQKKTSKLRLIKNKKNVGFAAANNQGIEIAKGKHVLFLNSDTLIADNLIGEMVRWMAKNPKVGISSCALKNKDGSLQGTGGYFPTLLRVFSWMTVQDLPLVDNFIKPFHPMKEKSFAKNSNFYKKERGLDWLTGAFMLCRKEVINDIGVWDTDYFMYTEDVDFCYRAKRAGWRIWYLPRWSIVHYGGASGTSESRVLSEFRGVKMFYKKHYLGWQYLVLRLLLKLGALWRAILLGIIEGKETAKIYAKAFAQA